ncbi:MAG: alpha/beta fold hydrolase, partial [Gammaproteobacteria bacterium]
MPRVTFSLDDLGRECAEFERKVAAGNLKLAAWRDEATPGAPRQVILQSGKTTLYRYTGDGAGLAPILVVYALVNRPYITDLHPARSMIRDLVQRGLEIYLIDWGYPDRDDRARGLDDYINRDLDLCIDYILGNHRIPALNLLGICQGGTFSVCYSAIHPDKVANLITTVTPIDFQTPSDLLSHLLRGVDVAAVVDTFGNIPGAWLNSLFLAQKPLQLSQQKYLAWLDQIETPGASEVFLAMERWIFDSPALAGAAFQEFAGDFYQRNGLVQNSIKIGDQTVDLNSVRQPILNIFARDDHLVPTDASRRLRDLVGTDDYSELE